MLEINKYQTQKYNAKMHNNNLDNPFGISKKNIKYSLNHLNDCTENPTIGLLARKKFETHRYPFISYKKNYEDLYSNFDIKYAEDIFEKKYKNLYNKTGRIRKILINHKNIELDKINPIKKNIKRKFYNILAKII